jgi:3'(2'), 5'-bisphosphate nucleotidase
LINITDVLATMKELSVIAGEEILKLYKKDIPIEYKPDQSPVTEADRRANYIITGGLKKAFPEMGILAEESADDLSRLKKKHCFVVDPLDGTKEFIKRNDEFTVNIALVEWGRPIGGVIYVPVYNELYYGFSGQGAYSLIQGREKRLKVSQRIGDIRLAKSRTHHSSKLDKLISDNSITRVIIAGSAYKGCLLARGDVEAYYRFGRTMEWDTAAMDIIVTEAGGIFSGMNGEPLVYNKKNPENPQGFYLLNNNENKLSITME